MLVAFVGEAGNAIIFMSLLVLLIIVGAYLIAYAAHCFLVVIEGTATGNDEVPWPDEPLFDWVWQGGVLVWLILVWLAPLGVILKASYPGILQEDPGLALLLAGVVLWLFFPIGVLSSLCSGSGWAFFSPKLLAALARIGATTLGFYAASFFVILCWLLPWYIALVQYPLLIPVAALLSTACLFIHARLLGRVAWKLSKLTALKTRRRKKKKKKPLPSPASESEPMPTPRRAVSEEEGEVYGLAAEEAPPPKTALKEAEKKRERAAYHLVDDPEEPAIPSASNLLKPIERKVMRAQDRIVIKEPPQSLFIGVYSFPLYETSVKAWMKLTIGATVVGIIIKLMIGGPT